MGFASWRHKSRRRRRRPHPARGHIACSPCGLRRQRNRLLLPLWILPSRRLGGLWAPPGERIDWLTSSHRPPVVGQRMQVQFFEVGTTAAESECSYDRAVVKVKDWRTTGPLEGTAAIACTSTSAGLLSKFAPIWRRAYAKRHTKTGSAEARERGRGWPSSNSYGKSRRALPTVRPLTRSH